MATTWYSVEFLNAASFAPKPQKKKKSQRTKDNLKIEANQAQHSACRLA
jgi:hypothetical protein